MLYLMIKSLQLMMIYHFKIWRKKKSLTEAASKELRSKFDLNAFKDKKG
jgi:hypothetical protein